MKIDFSVMKTDHMEHRPALKVQKSTLTATTVTCQISLASVLYVGRNACSWFLSVTRIGQIKLAYGRYRPKGVHDEHSERLEVDSAPPACVDFTSG